MVGLVLAAGSGSRLGSPKAMIQLDGHRLVDRAVATLRSGGAQPVVVVLGAAETSVPDATVVHNPDWASGMGSSLRVGLAALPADAAAVVVSLVDQPDVGPEVIARLVAAFRDGAVVAAATYGGRRGNPVLLAASTWAEVTRLAQGDVGARPFLAANPDLVTPVACEDVADPTDIDTPEDLAARESRQTRTCLPGTVDPPAERG